MINPLDIKKLNDLSKKEDLDISTLAYKINNQDDYKNENIVKVITKSKLSDRSSKQALNFSRLIYNVDKNIYHHFGVYLYKLSSLKKFIRLKKSKNEIKNRLEQLRAIDNNMKMDVILANFFSGGIDTKKDLEEYMKLFNK